MPKEYFRKKDMGSMRKLKAKYRILVKRMHPDILTAKGVKFNQDQANADFNEMHAEFERLKKWREKVDGGSGKINGFDAGQMFGSLSDFFTSKEEISESYSEFRAKSSKGWNERNRCVNFIDAKGKVHPIVKKTDIDNVYYSVTYHEFVSDRDGLHLIYNTLDTADNILANGDLEIINDKNQSYEE
jgi:hypothetical protein